MIDSITLQERQNNISRSLSALNVLDRGQKICYEMGKEE